MQRRCASASALEPKLGDFPHFALSAKMLASALAPSCVTQLGVQFCSCYSDLCTWLVDWSFSRLAEASTTALG